MVLVGVKPYIKLNEHSKEDNIFSVLLQTWGQVEVGISPFNLNLFLLNEFQCDSNIYAF